MSDIVEIALDKFTDYSSFERLGGDIALNEGYPTIHVLGGVHDGGRDGEQNSLFYSQGQKRKIIFQMSMEENALKKVRKTLRRLEERNEEFHAFVYITSRTVTTTNQDKIKKIMRKEFDIPIEIISRETIISRLSDFSNGIFDRYFPNIQAQLKYLQQQNGAKRIEINEAALLRTALTLNFGNSSHTAHNVTFDCLLLAVLSHCYPNTLTQDETIVEMRKICSACEYSSDNIRAAFTRLSKKNLVELTDQGATASEFAMTRANASEIRSEAAIDSLVDDIMNTMSEECGISNLDSQIELLYRNCREILVDFLRISGKEMVNISMVEEESNSIFSISMPEITLKSRRGVSNEKGDLLLACIAELIEKPNKDQARQISALSLSYVGAAILGLDPLLRELSAEKLATKTFVLDTDIIISGLVQETPMSEIYTSVVERLAESGANIIIPETCINECAEHARYSYKTYNYFQERLLALPETAVPEQVWNGFVKGYYFGRKRGLLPETMTYRSYIDNYFERKDPFRFMSEVVKEQFHESVTIKNMDDLITEDDIPQEKRYELEARIYEQLKERAKKAEYRTDDQTWELAKTDAKLFLSVYYLNSRNHEKQNRILPGSHYLVTSSFRYTRCANDIGLRDKVTTRLQPLMSTLKAMGKIDVSPSEFMRLLENPFLVDAVNGARDDIIGLIEAGMDLQGASLPRLRHDLNMGLHDSLTSARKAVEASDDETSPTAIDEDVYFKLVEDARNRGYGLTAGAKKLFKSLEAAKNNYEQKMKAIDEYVEEVSKFSKRRKRYLKRVEGRAKKK